MLEGTSQEQSRANHRRAQVLENQITELAAHIDAALFRWLELLHEFDEVKGWAGHGIKSCAHWLNWKCGIGLGAARERVRVARAMGGLPRICEAFRSGPSELLQGPSDDPGRELLENEAAILNIALCGTAAHVERVVRGYRKVKRLEALNEENARHEQRSLSWYFDDDGSFVLARAIHARAGRHPGGGAGTGR